MKQIIIICSFLILFSIIINNDAYAKEKTNNFIITIDPGHGGKDPGTSYKNILEKDINLSISFLLKNELIKNGFIVYMTREGDYDLSKPNAFYRKKSDFDNRIKLMKSVNSSLYLSIHLNYLYDSRYYGAQVFFDKNNERLAQIIQKELNNDFNFNRLVKEIPNLYMYKKLNIPGVLIECGFLSNYGERLKLINKDYQKEIVKSIVNAVIKYRKSLN